MNPDSFWLRDIEVGPGLTSLAAQVRLDSGRRELLFRHLTWAALAAARPQAVFVARHAYLIDDERARLDGVTLTSCLLVNHLRRAEAIEYPARPGLGEAPPRAFPYLVTEGPELAAWGEALPEEHRRLGRTIRYAAVKLAENEVEKRLLRSFGLRQVSAMNPGSLDLWPIEQQEPLFQLLAPWPERLGVTLRPDFTMKPDLATSGLFFPTETKFFNCQLCPLEHCPVRRVAFQGREGWD